MAKKVLNLNDMMEKWLNENLHKFSIEQIKSLRDNPDLLIEPMFKAVKQHCKEFGLDYTQTQVYGEEQKYLKRKEQEQVSGRKWAYLDSPLSQELFDMATHAALDRKIISTHETTYLYDRKSIKPVAFKVFMDAYVLGHKPSGRLTKRMAEKLIRFNEFYDQNYSLDMFEQLSRKEQLLFYAKHIADGLTEEQEQFVSQFIDKHDYLPIFRLIEAYYENSKYQSCIAARDYSGLCGGERKSLEQIQSDLGVTPQRAQLLVRRGFFGGLYHIDIPLDCWDPYQSLFTEPLLRIDSCHYEQIKEEEQLHMDINEYMLILQRRLPWAHSVWSVKRGDERIWGVHHNYYWKFRFYSFFNDIREEQLRKDRPKAVTIDLGRACKSKKYLSIAADEELTHEETEAIISILKTILKEMLGIEAKSNKFIFPARKPRTKK